VMRQVREEQRGAWGDKDGGLMRAMSASVSMAVRKYWKTQRSRAGGRPWCLMSVVSEMSSGHGA
jgi:hypothetical protein